MIDVLRLLRKYNILIGIRKLQHKRLKILLTYIDAISCYHQKSSLSKLYKSFYTLHQYKGHCYHKNVLINGQTDFRQS